jgi:hypothetical protein
VRLGHRQLGRLPELSVVSHHTALSARREVANGGSGSGGGSDVRQQVAKRSLLDHVFSRRCADTAKCFWTSTGANRQAVSDRLVRPFCRARKRQVARTVVRLSSSEYVL